MLFYLMKASIWTSDEGAHGPYCQDAPVQWSAETTCRDPRPLAGSAEVNLTLWIQVKRALLSVAQICVSACAATMRLGGNQLEENLTQSLVPAFRMRGGMTCH